MIIYPLKSIKSIYIYANIYIHYMATCRTIDHIRACSMSDTRFSPLLCCYDNLFWGEGFPLDLSAAVWELSSQPQSNGVLGGGAKNVDNN